MPAYLFFFNDTATTEIYTLSLHDALPISGNPASGSYAILDQWVDGGIRLWNGSGYDFSTMTDIQKPTLRLWKGYWLKLLKNDSNTQYSIIFTNPKP